ncbi:GNAT family N-acetyltransferase [Falsihalocynthiibacter sp. SS001]|uniref:GNAT family N-acetyltransferase n=1 Tax=Falsihalocynthiibacter sp. SS001 TaxID=3349698 RepID=UPI0036D3D6E6
MTNYYEVCERTWPPASTKSCGNFTIRNGAGGGKRVSAATLDGDLDLSELATAEDAMLALGQPKLFMIRDGEAEFDATLVDRGYALIDPVTIYTAPVSDLVRDLPQLACFSLYPPLAVMTDIWTDGGIGAERLAVMERAVGPKTGLLGRSQNRAAGVAYVGIHEKIAMLHSLEVKPAFRRQGVAVNIMCGAANWAQDQGADELSIIVTQANGGANALYSSLGMKPVGHYHYRIRNEAV